MSNMDVKKGVIGLVLSLLLGSGVAVASALPKCPTGIFAERHNCLGTFTYSDGETYVGEFKNGLKNGQGTKTRADGSNKYVGEWQSNGYGGRGTYTWEDGRKYVGEWQNSSMEGQGTLTFTDGTVQKGFWKDNEFVGTKYKWDIAEKKRIANEKKEKLARQKKKDKYVRIYNACLLDKGSDVDMQVSSLERAVKQTCKSIAKKPSWLENFRYD